MSGFDSRWLEQHQTKKSGQKKAMPNDRATKAKAKAMLASIEAKDQKRRAKEEEERYFASLCTSAGLPTPIAEHKFHPTRKWRIDYFFRRGDIKVGLEIEGGLWVNGGGGHNRPTHFLKQIEKYNAFSAEGIYLIRTTPTNLYTQGIKDVLAVFENQ